MYSCPNVIDDPEVAPPESVAAPPEPFCAAPPEPFCAAPPEPFCAAPLPVAPPVLVAPPASSPAPALSAPPDALAPPCPAFAPLPSDDLEAYEVSTLVNSPRNDSVECARRLSPAVDGAAVSVVSSPPQRK